MEDIIINKVATSGLITLDLEQLYNFGEGIAFDIAPFLYENTFLKEKLFREKVTNFDWEIFKEKNIAIFCSIDTIIPHWAYMIVINRIISHAKLAIIGSLQDLENHLYTNAIAHIDLNQYVNQKIVIKGCSSKVVPLIAYGEITRILTPIAASIMFGEPCSTVPVFKRK